MKTSRYTEAQIIAILRQAEGGVPVADLCREHGMALLRNLRLRHDSPFPPASADTNDLGGAEGVDAVDEGDADPDFGGLAIRGEPLRRH